jgi:hypothetical protein
MANGRYRFLFVGVSQKRADTKQKNCHDLEMEKGLLPQPT